MTDSPRLDPWELFQPHQRYIAAQSRVVDLRSDSAGQGVVLSCDRVGHETDPDWFAQVGWDGGRVERVHTRCLAPASLYTGSIAHLLGWGPNPELIAAYAHPRERTHDEVMFRVETAPGCPVTFRLQLFQAGSLRPVALATQAAGDAGGPGGATGRVSCVLTVGEQFFPGQPRPPLWVWNFVDYPPEDRVRLVTVTPAVGRGSAVERVWTVEEDQVEQLVGQRVDWRRRPALRRRRRFWPLVPSPARGWLPRRRSG